MIFNFHATDRVHLVFHDGTLLDHQDGFLLGSYPDRRMAYLVDMDEVRANASKLRNAIEEWIRLKS